MSSALRTQRHELATKALRALQRWSKCVIGSEARAIHLAFAQSYLNQAAELSARLDFERAWEQPAAERAWEHERFERERLDSVNAMLSAHRAWTRVPS